jgi:hypothetical protein
MSVLALVRAATIVAAAAPVVVVAPPRPAWRGAAEHARGFWTAWDLAPVGVGEIAVAGLDWCGWFTFWGAIGSLQPAMIADLCDVGRQARSARRQPSEAPTSQQAVRPIRWHAPGFVAPPSSGPRAAAGRSPRRLTPDGSPSRANPSAPRFVVPRYKPLRREE